MSEETAAREFTRPEQSTILASLRADCCPACGDVKQQKQTFCGGCWRRLTWQLRGPLYHRAPEYFAAFWEAFEYLRDGRRATPSDGGGEVAGARLFVAGGEPPPDDGRPMPGLPRGAEL